MRWPWQRPAREPVAESAAGRSAVPAPAAPASPTRPPAPPAMGWAHLPPLQRSVAPSATLAPGTGSWTTLGHSPGLMGVIGHEVSADGPTGIVDGDGRGLGPDEDRRAEVAVPVVSRQVAPVASGRPLTSIRSPLVSADPTRLPLVSYPAGEDLPLAHPPHRHAGSADSDGADGPPVQRLTSEATTIDQAPVTALPLGDIAAVAAEAARTGQTEVLLPRPAPGPPAAPAGPGTQRGVPARPSQHKPGLGAPLPPARADAGPAIQRAAAADRAAPSAAPTLPTVSRSTRAPAVGTNRPPQPAESAPAIRPAEAAEPAESAPSTPAAPSADPQPASEPPVQRRVSADSPAASASSPESRPSDASPPAAPALGPAGPATPAAGATAPILPVARSLGSQPAPAARPTRAPASSDASAQRRPDGRTSTPATQPRSTTPPQVRPGGPARPPAPAPDRSVVQRHGGPPPAAPVDGGSAPPAASEPPVAVAPAPSAPGAPSRTSADSPPPTVSRTVDEGDPDPGFAPIISAATDTGRRDTDARAGAQPEQAPQSAQPAQPLSSARPAPASPGMPVQRAGPASTSTSATASAAAASGPASPTSRGTTTPNVGNAPVVRRSASTPGTPGTPGTQHLAGAATDAAGVAGRPPGASDTSPVQRSLDSTGPSARAPQDPAGDAPTAAATASILGERPLAQRTPSAAAGTAAAATTPGPDTSSAAPLVARPAVQRSAEDPASTHPGDSPTAGAQAMPVAPLLPGRTSETSAPAGPSVQARSTAPTRPQARPAANRRGGVVDSPAAASNLPTVSRTARSDSLTSLAPVGTPRVSGAGTAFDPPPGLASSPVDPAGPSADAGPVGSTRLSSDSARPAGAVATLLAPARIQRSTLATHPLLPMTRPGHLDRSRPAARSGAAFGHTTSPAADSAVAPLVPRTVAADTTQPAHANGAAPLEVLQRAWSSARPRRSTRRRALLGPPDQPPPPPPPVSPPPDEPPALPEPDPAPAAAEPEGGARGVTDLEPTDLDLLAGKLLDPLLRRLRQELLLDRERRGLRADRR